MKHQTALDNLANAETQANLATASAMKTFKISAIVISLAAVTASTAFIATKLLPTSSIVASVAKVEMTSEMKSCMENDTNPMLVELRKMQQSDVGAKFALQETCRQLIEATKMK